MSGLIVIIVGLWALIIYRKLSVKLTVAEYSTDKLTMGVQMSRLFTLVMGNLCAKFEVAVTFCS